MKSTHLAALIVVGLLGGAAGYFAGGGRPSPWTSAPLSVAEAIEGDHVVAEGRLEPAGGVLQLAVLPGEKISRIDCVEGSQVQAGQVLVVLESYELHRSEYELAKARLETAEKQFQIELELARGRTTEAELLLRQAQLAQRDAASQSRKVDLGKAQQEQASRDLERLSRLASDERTKNFLSSQQLEQQRLVRDQAAHEFQRGLMVLEASQESSELNVSSAENAVRMAELGGKQVETADPRKSLALARDAAEQRMNLSQLKAPVDGQVLRVMGRVGERAGNLPLLQVADLREMACVADVYDSQLGFLRVGNAAVITSPAIQEELHGEITRIGSIIGDPDFPSPDPMALQDRHSAKVTIALDEASQALASKFVHLRVQVRIARNGPSTGSDNSDD